MLWLMFGCAPHRVSLPIAAAHHGPATELPILPLQSVWVTAVDGSCTDVVDGFRFAWTMHAEQLIHPDAAIRLNIQNCGVSLTERVQINLERSQETGTDSLEALLSARGWATVFVEREEKVLDVIRVETFRIDQQDWVGGGLYSWREPMAAAVEWALVEELEAKLLPHVVLRALHPSSHVLMAAAEQAVETTDKHSQQSPPQATPGVTPELPIAQQGQAEDPRDSAADPASLSRSGADSEG